MIEPQTMAKITQARAAPCSTRMPHGGNGSTDEGSDVRSHGDGGGMGTGDAVGGAGCGTVGGAVGAAVGGASCGGGHPGGAGAASGAGAGAGVATCPPGVVGYANGWAGG